MSRYILAAAFCLGLVPAAQATVIDGGVTDGTAFRQGGTFIKLGLPFTESDPDNTVGENNFDTPNLYAFDEDQDIDVTTDVTVDIGTNLMAGDVVDSHYVFFDPLFASSQIGFVLFDAPIYGIISSTSLLEDSDSLVNTGVTYVNSPTGMRGLEPGDLAVIDPGNPSQLLVDWAAAHPGDYVRVLTMEATDVASPSLVALFGIGLLGLGVTRRRRRN